MFLDASLIVAVLAEEAECEAVRLVMRETRVLATSPLAMFEASSRIAQVQKLSIDRAYEIVAAFLDESAVDVLPIDDAVGAEAHACASRYHHSTKHPARLNMGDCFAYASARTSGLKLAYKGNDFVHTDIDGLRFGA